MKLIISLTALLFSATTYGQTKLISFRSHSGNNAHFRTAVENDLFDIGRSNFGIVYKIKVIDSVMWTPDNSIIIVRKDDSLDGTTRFLRETFTWTNAPELFKASSVDSLKLAIRNKIKYANLENTHFIGFDKKFKANKK